MLGGQHLGEDAAERDLAPGAARLDIGQHPLQVADAGRQRLHLAHTLEHLLELVADQLEAGAEPVLEGLVQLFIDCGAHRLELFGVVAAHRFEPALDRTLQRIAEPNHRPGYLLAQLAGFLGGEAPATRELVAPAAVEASERRLDRRLVAADQCAKAQQQHDPGRQGQRHCHQCGEGDRVEAHRRYRPPFRAISPRSP